MISHASHSCSFRPSLALVKTDVVRELPQAPSPYAALRNLIPESFLTLVKDASQAKEAYNAANAAHEPIATKYLKELADNLRELVSKSLSTARLTPSSIEARVKSMAAQMLSEVPPAEMQASLAALNKTKVLFDATIAALNKEEEALSATLKKYHFATFSAAESLWKRNNPSFGDRIEKSQDIQILRRLAEEKLGLPKV